ncbi:hypothetical protein FGB62_267g07 [Gracilaria domingensis]|nr:hypothetical protein FGB62_267g07 [Gracilaria domingensis]
MGSSYALFEIVPLTISLILSVIFIGCRFRWWFRANAVTAQEALAAIEYEPSLRHGVMAFAAGWNVAISGMLVVIMLHSDCGEDGPRYFAGLRYLWHPKQWIDEQHIGTKLPVPNDPRQVHTLLERAPLHVGNAIVGTDRDFCKEEDKIASRLQKVVLIAEHLVVLPLLFAIVVILARNYDNLDQVHYEALARLAEGAIFLRS